MEAAMVICPACSGNLDFDEDDLDEGDEFTCDDCAATLRVKSVGPLELSTIDDKEDDEEEDDDEEEEEFEEEEEEDEEEEQW